MDHEFTVWVNLDDEAGNSASGHGQEQEEEYLGMEPTSTPVVIRKKIVTIAKEDGEVDAFVDAAMRSQTEKAKIKEKCSSATETTDSDSWLGSNSFHFAAKHGFTEVVMLMTAMGFTKLLWDDSDNKSPVEVAVDEEHYDTAEVLLRRMDKKKAIQLFKRHNQKNPRISFFKLLNDLTDLQKEKGNEEKCQEESSREKVLQLQDFLLAVLDTTVSEHEVDLELLVADENGKIPKETYGKEKVPKTCYSVIVFNKLEMLQKHESFETLVQKKWTNYGQIAQSLSFLWYMMFMVFLTTSLVLAARSTDPFVYSRPIDKFRLFCEIVTFILVIFDTILEVKDYYETYKNTKQNTGSHWEAFKAHFYSAPNCLDFLGLLTVWLIIPCRITDSNWQWVFAAIAYILHGLRIFKHAIMFWSVAVYIRILLRIITRDLAQFLLVMVVVVIAFGGGLYFALRGEPNPRDFGSGSGSDEFDPVYDTDLGLFPDDTKEIYLSWLIGFRILNEGSVLDYYGKDGPGDFGVLGAFIYWLFVFTVTIILLSLLIAQFSVSFEEQKETAGEGVTVTRTELLQQIHIFFPTFLLKTLQNINGRIRHLIDGEFRPELLKIKRLQTKAQEAQSQLVARQERLEVETFKMQHTVHEICKILKDVQKDVERVLEKVGG